MSETGQPEPPHLGPLEQDVMNVLWVSCEVNDEPLPIRAVADNMPDLAYTTIATVLSNLKRKGMVESSAISQSCAIGPCADAPGTRRG